MGWDNIKGFFRRDNIKGFFRRENIRDLLRWDRLKVVLRWVGGVLLALLAVIMFFAFIASATARDSLGQRMYKMAAADVILMWLVILGTGAPGALLLRRAILDKKQGGAARKIEFEDDEEEDFDGEDSTDEE